MIDWRPICSTRPATAKRVKSIAVAQRMGQAAHARRRCKAPASTMQKMMPNSSAATENTKSGMAVGHDALDDALARPDAEPVAADDRLTGGIDLEGVALPGQELVDTAGHMRAEGIGDEEAAAAPRPPAAMIQIHGMPAMKNMAPQTAVVRMVWPRSGWATSSAATMPKSRMAKRLPGISGWRACSANSQAQTTTKAGFMNSDGWIEMPAIEIQRRRALDLHGR